MNFIIDVVDQVLMVWELWLNCNYYKLNIKSIIKQC